MKAVDQKHCGLEESGGEIRMETELFYTRKCDEAHLITELLKGHVVMALGKGINRRPLTLLLEIRI